MTTRDLSRRTLLTAAGGAALAVGLDGGTAAAAPTGRHAGHHPGRRPARGGAGVVPGATAFVQVSVATAWSAPRLTRPLDRPSSTNPVDLDAWNAAMPETTDRSWLSEGKLETQAMFGRRVLVDEIDGEWAEVVVVDQPTPRDPRGYPGWIPVRQLVADPRFAALTSTMSTATVTARRTRLHGTPLGGHRGLPVSFDTILPVLGAGRHLVRVAVPGGGAAYVRRRDVVLRAPGEQPPTPTVEDVVATGMRFVGLRYLWAGVSAWGFDCSGFTSTIFHHHGITLPRDSGPQLNASGFPKVDRADLRRGDLVFFANKPGGTRIRHVAMYLGDDMILQSPNSARSVEVMSLTEYDTKGEYAGAVRVIA
ncbi:C40 family peptidase [Mobilicoccus pelagius]|uniref:NlpC/P60 domain-containing protein n=1 Tax=Mobilicoccus pelagius NBRC 104925 TaxID=1089455 RepID=H5UU58_9MICO|nr:C40 family peptidase [Mobilicoccus pelagius]GAB49266.1 hypothetical protein MOPEL_099_00660 [Mobilicoccus pelagius NBRC 104925]